MINTNNKKIKMKKNYGQTVKIRKISIWLILKIIDLKKLMLKI
uniref:Uncharacterized protein n=1 Tax=viral metagenome TaxID=1070528 RepID=A0A6C0ADZ2_9ZZZZ